MQMGKHIVLTPMQLEIKSIQRMIQENKPKEFEKHENNQKQNDKKKEPKNKL